MRNFLVSLFLLIGWQLSSSAQVFTTLDWNVLRIDSVLPVYTELVPLESDYRNYTYQVRLDYPQYQEISKDEYAKLAPFASQISDSIMVNAQVGVQRGEGMLDLSFVPLVRKNKQYYKLLSARIRIVPIPKPLYARLAPEQSARYAAHSVLSSGKWVKISVTQEGIYQLTRSALKQMGFSNPDRVRLYGYGGHSIHESLRSVYDDLQEVPLYYNASHDNWLFWANGLLYWDNNTRIFNPYARAAYYFLTEADAPSSCETHAPITDQPVSTFNTFTDHVLYEKDEYAWHTVGRNLYESYNYATGGSRTYTLHAPHSAGNEQLTVAFTASSEERTTLSPSVNGKDLSDMILGAISKYVYATSSTRTFDVSQHRTANNSWNVRLSCTAGHDARLDYLALHYSRQLALDNGYVAFSGKGYNVSSFHIAAPQGAKVMRIGTPSSPYLFFATTHQQDSLQVVVDNPSQRYVCFDPSYTQFPQPTVVGSLPNQDLHALDSVDMVILVPASGKLTRQAQRLADAHATHDGLRTVVVRADQVYNEFSSGTPDATAYRRFMKMLYDKASDKQTAPRYLLLMGDAAWDNRMLSTAWRKSNPDDYLLCYSSDNSLSDTRSYVMEDYFGLLDDGEGVNLLSEKTDLGIGRFPVTTETEAKVMVDKAIDYLNNRYAGDWRNRVCMLGDDGDENEHMRYCDDVCQQIEQLNPQIDLKKVMWDAFTRVSTAKSNTYPDVEKLLDKQLKEGALVMNYTGHANPTALSHEYVLEINDFSQMESKGLPLWVTAACDVMPFDGNVSTIGETAVLNPKGAAIAFYGTTRTVYAYQNRMMNLYFMQYLFDKDSNGKRYRLGDAVRLAKNAIISAGETSLRENKLQFVLLGDPALTIGAPIPQVQVDSINGESISQANSLVLRAGSQVRINGHIEDGFATLMNQFNGVLSCRMYDTPTLVKCNNNDRASSVFSFTDRSSFLFSVRDSVRNGEFSLSFNVPVDLHYDEGFGRMVFYALSDDRQTEANGCAEHFTFDAAEEELLDKQGPTIQMFLCDETFQEGGEVPSQPQFIAHLSDESGINVSGNGIGHDLSLCVDGKASHTFNLNDYYESGFGGLTQGTVAFTLPQLEDGPHQLTFRAWDMLNNTSMSSLSFVVNSSIKPKFLQVSASPMPAVHSTNFVISHDRPGTDCQILVEVFDFAGRKLWAHSTVSNSSNGICTIPWNLSTGQGGRLGAGIYLYRCTLKSGESKEVTKSQKIIILNNK